jgi:hexosaminidase
MFLDRPVVVLARVLVLAGARAAENLVVRRRWAVTSALWGLVACVAAPGAAQAAAAPAAPADHVKPAAPAKSGEAAPIMSLVPQPAKIEPKSGFFALYASTKFAAPAPLRALAERFAGELRAGTGLPLPVGAPGGGKAIALALDPQLAAALGDEGYRLRVAAGKVEVRAAKPAGIFYGLQTFRQLLPPEVFRRAPSGQIADWRAPCVEIEDKPRFSWRGSHLDVGRHFQSKEAILKHLDLMAMHKLNVFQWHLTEDQGWRLEIKKYPKLTEVGAWRKDSALGPPPEDETVKKNWRFAGKGHGGFYTQDDAREVVRYAADRFITVVPEIEMPGHAKAAIAAYPELGNTGAKVEVETTWGVFHEIFSPTDQTLHFLQDVLEEVLAIFPSKFIHVGGDEAVKTEWKASPVAQARMKALGLKSEEQLQSWFIQQMGAWLNAHGRRLVGWDEILEGGLAPGATVMAWRGIEHAVAAAKLGHDAVMAPTDWTYLDYLQSKDPNEPVGIGGNNPLENVYAFDPIPGALPPELEKHILGGQAQIWTEYIPNAKHLEYMAWPRLCALAETVWSPRAARDFAGFKARLAGGHLARLGYLDVAYRPLTGPLPTALTIP